MSCQDIHPTKTVQRLDAPRFSREIANAVLTPGVGEHAGLTQAERELYGPMFSFAYMANEAFGRGVLGRMLRSIAAKSERGEMVCASLTLCVQPTGISAGKMPRKATFYIIQPKELQAVYHAQNIIQDQANEESIALLEPMKLKRAVFALGQQDRQESNEPIGWLELENGFFVFLDYDAFVKTADHFHICRDHLPARQEPTPVPPEKSELARRPAPDHAPKP